MKKEYPFKKDSISYGQPFRDMEEAAADAAPAFGKFFAASWNLLVNFISYIKLMWLFQKAPWLFVVLIFITMAIIPPLGVFFMIAGLAALNYNVKSDNGFLINTNKKDIPFDFSEKEDIQGEAMLRVLEAGHSIEHAAIVHDAIGKLYDKNHSSQGEAGIIIKDIAATSNETTNLETKVNKTLKADKFIPDDIGDCRKIIVTSMNEMTTYFSGNSKEDGDIWDLLLVDFLININAIKIKPESIPVMCVALMGSINLLGEVADQYKDIKFINLREHLAISTYDASSKLISIYGRKINDEEMKNSLEFIESIYWHSESKSFISKHIDYT